MIRSFSSYTSADLIFASCRRSFCLGRSCGDFPTYRRFQDKFAVFRFLGCPVLLQSLQHRQAGLLEGTRCLGKLNPTFVSPFCPSLFAHVLPHSLVSELLVDFVVSHEICLREGRS